MPTSLDCLGQTCLTPSLRLARRLQKKKLSERRVGRSELQRVLSQLFLRVGCSLYYIAGFQSFQWLNSCVFPGDAETILVVSGNEDVSTGVESLAVEGASHSCYQEPVTVGWVAPALCP